MIWSAFKLSCLVVSVSTVAITIVGTAVAYLLAKHDFWGKELLDSLITLPIVLPPTVTGYYLIVLLGRHGWIGEPLYRLTGWTVTFTWQAAAIAASVVAFPFMVKSARAAMESVDPQYETASYTLGKGKLETFFRVTVPLAKKGIIAGIILSFARALGEFGATLMLAGNIQGKTQTMPLAIYEALISGANTKATILAVILTTISIAVIYTSNKLNGSKILG